MQKIQLVKETLLPELQKAHQSIKNQDDNLGHELTVFGIAMAAAGT